MSEDLLDFDIDGLLEQGNGKKNQRIIIYGICNLIDPSGTPKHFVLLAQKYPAFLRLIELLHFERTDPGDERSRDPREEFYATRARYRGVTLACNAARRRTRSVMELTAAITFVATSSLLRRPNESVAATTYASVEVCARFRNSFSTYLRSSSRDCKRRVSIGVA